MKIVFLIGNGFDLNLGLKTSYKDFYSYYLETPSLTPTIEKFKKTLGENIDTWADLELTLGDYVKNFDDKNMEDFIFLLDDIQDCLADYLELQVMNTNLSLTYQQKENLGKDLVFLDRHLTEKNKRLFKEFREPYINIGHEVRVIVFNYTNTLESLLGYKNTQISLNGHQIGNVVYQNYLKEVLHIHGTTQDNMILGVNDSSQISNEQMKGSSLLIQSLVKPELNKNTETLRDVKAKEFLENAECICIFGMSLGKTDNHWWQYIAEQLKSSKKLLIIFARSSDIVRRRAYKGINIQEQLKQRLMSTIELSAEEKVEISKRIIVALNSNMFKV